MEFINHLNDKNVKIDVYISTYDTIFKDDLTDIFKDNLIGCDLYNNLIGQGNLIQNSIKKIKVSEYDFLLFMRIDLFIKKCMIFLIQIGISSCGHLYVVNIFGIMFLFQELMI